MTAALSLTDPFVWIDPADAVFVASCREALAIERKAYAAADGERRELLARLPGWELLSSAQRADVQAHVRGLTVEADTYPMPSHGWTCFHCGEIFRTPGGARLHFGARPSAPPICIEVRAAQSDLDDINGRLA